MTENQPLHYPHQAPGENKRVTLVGNVDALPHLRRTPKTGTEIATFPLAVHPDPDDREATQHHLIRVFGKPDKPASINMYERAATLIPGEEVEVIGYPHEVERPDKHGQMKKRTEIWAASLRRTKPSATQEDTKG